jgi:hypothetical protein
MYVGGLLNNVEQHANIDHNNDFDNHVNLATVLRFFISGWKLIAQNGSFKSHQIHKKN